MENNQGESQLFVLFSGYSNSENCSETNVMKANCSCVLIKGQHNIIIDTRTAWDAEELCGALRKLDITPQNVDYVVCTHGHSDHIGCNYLFNNATHIVGFSISFRDTYFLTPDFANGEEYVINKQVKIIATPGHTLQDVTVLFTTPKAEMIAITGDLFEKEEDIHCETIWQNAGSDSIELQRSNRRKILNLASYIIPGHGPMFKPTKMYI